MIKKEQIKVLLEALENGTNITDSCLLAKIGRDTFYRKYKQDAEFKSLIDRTRLRNKARLISLIQKAMKEHWQAAAWWLERRYPDEFSSKNTPAISQNLIILNGKNVYDKLPPDKLLEEFNRRRREFGIGRNEDKEEEGDGMGS